MKVSAYFLRQSDPRFPDDADDEGDEVDDEAVDEGNENDLHASPDYIEGKLIRFGLKRPRHLHISHKRPNGAENQGAKTDFLYPGRGFPGSEEKGDEKQGNDDHPGRTTGQEPLEKIDL